MGRYRRLTLAERYQIEVLVRSGHSLRFIARQLQRQASTICRELQRVKEIYGAEEAEQLCVQVRRRAHPELRKIRGEREKFIRQSLIEDHSPEQIAGFLAGEGISIAPQTLYRYIHRDRSCKGTLWQHLRHLRRKTCNGKPRHRPTRMDGRRMIDERPKIVERRKRVGDYERDTVLGKRHGPMLLTIVDRTSRYLKLGWVPKNCSHLIHKETLRLLKDEPVRTITNDNGTEFSRHRATEQALKAKIYFAHAYHAWERGTNENTNGLLRQYFPKKKAIGRLTHRDLRIIEDRMNHRPRKCLGFKTPAEVHHHLSSPLLR